MDIVGLDSLVFGVDDIGACATFLTDFGLTATAEAGVFEALDGTAIRLHRRDDPALPPALPSGSMLRETVYAVSSAAVLEDIRAEISRDRVVSEGADGSIGFTDDAGFALRFRTDRRRPVTLPGERVNIPGQPPLRGVNELGVSPEADLTPRTLSHVVYFVPDFARAEAFYAERLGFRTVDRFTDVGPFMRPAGTTEHHTLFLIQTPPQMTGIEHFSFHMAGPTGLMQAGARLSARGYQTFWGPGRHNMGSNWFWYFNCPMGCHAEYDADMDQHDDQWVPREMPPGPESSQSFLMQLRQKWAPMGPRPAPRGEAGATAPAGAVA
ncbi:VOC family protein [Roseomonas sp. GC11]|uniref:VOC family protein n=1 Tax=Roseomonas sp. GC11 TaxID=2950546 RepID=UPI002108F089|nr:VOC family protein [Roseomonas sp. GC11]MCQ4159484.1 VOC family protein [Roseomonas sp. GC11]